VEYLKDPLAYSTSIFLSLSDLHNIRSFHSGYLDRFNSSQIKTTGNYRFISMSTQQTAKTRRIAHADGTTFAYRKIGATSGTPLLFLMHFRGTMDHWDPLLINIIAAERTVILVDYQGVGQSIPGTVKSTIKEMAADVHKFLALTGIRKVDLLGFSIGGMVAQLVALNADPKFLEVRKVILCGTTPSAGPDLQTSPNQQGMAIHAQAKIVGLSDMATLFFPSTKEGVYAAEAYWDRLHERDVTSSGEKRSEYLSQHFLDGGEGLKNMLNTLIEWSTPEKSQELNGSYDRLPEMKVPVLVANGHVSSLRNLPR
jgi:pimeloyl-ACP methyl ester carboxylesterase